MPARAGRTHDGKKPAATLFLKLVLIKIRTGVSPAIALPNQLGIKRNPGTGSNDRHRKGFLFVSGSTLDDPIRDTILSAQRNHERRFMEPRGTSVGDADRAEPDREQLGACRSEMLSGLLVSLAGQGDLPLPRTSDQSAALAALRHLATTI